MRFLIPTLVLAALAPTASAAQESRFSFEIAGGAGTTSPIVAHDLDAAGFAILPGTMATRLSIADGSVASAQLRGRYAVGRIDIDPSLYDSMLPAYNWVAAPRSQTIRSWHLSLGFRIPSGSPP